jgi:microcystin-dependent protein
MDAFIGEIRAFPYTFAPLDWVACDGQNLPCSPYQALYALISNTYGGTPNVNFNVPNLNNSSFISTGMGPGLTPRSIAQTGGSAVAGLALSNMAPHTHPLGSEAIITEGCSTAAANITTPIGGVEAKQPASGGMNMFKNAAADKTMKDGVAVFSGTTDAFTGGINGHENRMPFVQMGYFICTYGYWPSRPDQVGGAADAKKERVR